jgi:transcriptional regulator with XRE-family HTH domain
MNDNNIRIKLGLAIKDERVRIKLSQEQLAFECNLHRTYIGSVERGERNISLENIVKIASSLKLTASELLKRAKL